MADDNLSPRRSGVPSREASREFWEDELLEDMEPLMTVVPLYLVGMLLADGRSLGLMVVLEVEPFL